MGFSSALVLLNPAQRQAVEHVEGPLLVVAGAGSGKTRVLTYRIANLIETHGVDPGQIMAVTFTNKAAEEMRQRIQVIFCEARAMHTQQMPYAELLPADQTKIQRWVKGNITNPLWVGTFHALCGRLLRSCMEEYQDWAGRRWHNNFSISDESDAQSMIKQIMVHELNLDDKQYPPRQVRYQISRAKNLGLTPEEFLQEEGANFKNKQVAKIYERYQARLAENNTLDFDDLIWIPTRIFAQNPQLLAYWHRRFQHILVDEYQDTNRTQYQLIQQLSTGCTDARSWQKNRETFNWQGRSVFVVGDADQSIYSFRCADFRIILEFQSEIGSDRVESLIKLEENYRSTPEILAVANSLIGLNQERLDKVLRPTRASGPRVYCHFAADEEAESQFIVRQMIELNAREGKRWKDCAILYRTNSQSRAIEDQLRQSNIPYTVVGGLKFYDRKEVKDIISYLKLIHNPQDSLSLRRAIGMPRRGIGAKSLETLALIAAQQEVSLWQIMRDATTVKTALSRASKAVGHFVDQVINWQRLAETENVFTLLDHVMRESGYVAALVEENTQESENRLENLAALCDSAQRFTEKSNDPSLTHYLASVSLSSDTDDLDETRDLVSLMTIHAAKGLEFPVVFLTGLEQGLFPHSRSLDDPGALEEERRLCYVALTRAQQRLYLTYTQERMLWGEREPALPSQFLSEIPEDLIVGSLPHKKRKQPTSGPASNAKIHRVQAEDLTVGERIVHKTLGQGRVTHILSGNGAVCIAVEFPSLGKKIINPKQTAIYRLET